MFKKLMLLVLVTLILFATGIGSWAKSVYVKGYTRKDGTYVAPHYRSAPDGNFSNNWSTKGNVNPYTGKEGTKVTPPPTQSYPSYVPPITYSPVPLASQTETKSLVNVPDIPVKEQPTDIQTADNLPPLSSQTETQSWEDSIPADEQTEEPVKSLDEIIPYAPALARTSSVLVAGSMVTIHTPSKWGLNFRVSPDSAAERIPSHEVLPEGTTLHIVSREGDWLFVRANLKEKSSGDLSSYHGYVRWQKDGVPYVTPGADKPTPTTKKSILDKTKVVKQPKKSSVSSKHTTASDKPISGKYVAPRSQTNQIVHVTRTGAKFHAAGCRYLARSDIPMSLSDAKASGYTACSICGGIGASGYKTVKPRPAPTRSVSSDMVHITRTGAKYHAGGCRYLNRSDMPISRKDAIRQGYTPCSICGGG
ncbi:MAG: hypothetical protein ACYC27_21665 [Armatimonadota bacterium]